MNQKDLTADILRKAREIIADRAHWHKGCLARDKGYRTRGVTKKNAVSFCAYGACMRAWHLYQDTLEWWGNDDNRHKNLMFNDAVKSAVMELQRSIPYDDADVADALLAAASPVTEYNDFHATTHADILALFDRAIERLEAE